MREPTHAPDFSAVRGKRLLIALSGGADSVALAVMLAESREEYGLTLFAAHVDHGIRPGSAEDAEFCRALCAGLDIPFLTARVDVPAEARKNRWGLETAARNCRYAQLRAFLGQTRSDYIALAHHMDDQAETVLMHLFRGAGVDGLCGMRALDGESALYRPLLGYRKAELTDFLRRRGYTWREDPTNRVADNPRNALRLDVLPQLERWYPQLARAVTRTAQIAQAESDLMDRLTRDYVSRAAAGGPTGSWLELDPRPHRAVLRRALLAICPEKLSWEQVNALEALCAQNRGKLDIGGSCRAERTGRRLYFVPKRLPTIAPIPLSLNGETALPGIGTIAASPCAPAPVRDDPMTQVLDTRALEGAVVRTRREGDRIRPLGGGDRLLSDYLIDRKVDRPLRDGLMLVARENRVLWVCGQGISQEARITDETRRAVRLACRYLFDTCEATGK